MTASAPTGTSSVQGEEKPVKANFVCQFPSFLGWEKHAPPEEGQPVRLGILGEDPFNGELEKAVKAHLAKGRLFEIEQSPDPEELLDCHLVFLGLELGGNFDAALEKLHDAGIATVADQPGAAKRGALINLVVVHGRVCFEINLDTTKRAGIKVSSQLLKLAILVRSEGEEPRGKAP